MKPPVRSAKHRRNKGCEAARRIGRAVAWVAIAAITLSGCRRQPAPAPAGRPTPRVTVATAVAADVPVYLDEIGRTVSSEIVSIVPQVGGKIIAAPVENGAFVEKGQLLFEIDPRPFEAAVAAARASLAQSKADLSLAKVEFRRVQNLITTNAVSQLEFDQAESLVAVDQAKVDAADAALVTAQLNLEYTKIYSPLTGRAGVRMIDAGNVVKDNGPPMLVIQRFDPIYAEFTVTENDLLAVRRYLADRGLDMATARQHLRVEVSIPGGGSRSIQVSMPPASYRPASAASVPASAPATVADGATSRPSAGREGSLIFMDNAVQPTSGTIRLRAILPNADRHFWPGQFVNVRVILEMQNDTILIPAQAQQIAQQGPYVYVVKSDQTAEIRPIVPGQRQGELLAVDKGLAAGDRVIVSGQLLVVPGSKVEVVP